MFCWLLLIGSLLGYSLADVQYAKVECTPGEQIYQFSATLLDESATINFEQYSGKVLLIVNVASYDGLTEENYNLINELADYFDGQDFEILGFPSSEFGKGEPGAGEEIVNAVRYVNPGGGFEPELTFFEKINTNGDEASDIYLFLKSHCPWISDTFQDGINYDPKQVGDVNGNFEKFLLGRDGIVYYRYNPTTYESSDIIPDIESLLNNSS